MRVAHLFITTYSIWYDKTGSVDTALRKGIDNFTYRYPFNQLNNSDITNIVEMCSNSESPHKSLARLMQYADTHNSIDVLYDYVEQMNEYVVHDK